jgi:hypothetical protein
MIEPSYRRDHLWGPPRSHRGAAIAFAVAFGFVAGINVLAPSLIMRGFDDTPANHAEAIVFRLVAGGFPEWRAHHAGCPHRLGELLPYARLDPWGHAMHFTCDHRLMRGRDFAVVSAGADGLFGTSDDIEAHR